MEARKDDILYHTQYGNDKETGINKNPRTTDFISALQKELKEAEKRANEILEEHNKAQEELWKLEREFKNGTCTKEEYEERKTELEKLNLDTAIAFSDAKYKVTKLRKEINGERSAEGTRNPRGNFVSRLKTHQKKTETKISLVKTDNTDEEKER